MLGLTKQDRINTVYGDGGHVVILGAGASIASTKRNPLSNGKQLPSMDNLVDIVELNDVIDGLPDHLKAKNFETLYSNLHKDNQHSTEIKEIERRVYEYFKDMTLPDEPTIYDYLILSLRPRDIIATFNWDPLLDQAWVRNERVADVPYIAYLHGNVAIGFSNKNKQFGTAGMYSMTNEYFEPTKLLYPITNKNYNYDEFIVGQWDLLNNFLSNKLTKRLTIFGYGAPSSDIEAIELMNKAWGTGQQRDIEEFEIIDIRSEEEILKQWENFIYRGHTTYTTNYFQSSLANNPRRTFESFHQHSFPKTADEAWSESNPIRDDLKTLSELWEWHKPLIKAEKIYSNKKGLKKY